jgi:hypothetical protein
MTKYVAKLIRSAIGTLQKVATTIAERKAGKLGKRLKMRFVFNPEIPFD